MDPLSITASVVAVLQLTQILLGYINCTRHATKEQARIAVELGNLYSLLIRLRFRVEDAKSGDPWFENVRLLGAVDGPLDQFRQVLERMMHKIEPTWPSSSSEPTRRHIFNALSKVTWMFNKSEVEEMLNQIERLITVINLALTDDLITLSQTIHSNTVMLAEQVNKLQTGVLIHNLSEWLGAPDPSVNYQAALEKRHPGTGMWLLDGLEFQNWKTSESSSLMWLHGKAGSGKTVLSSIALAHMIKTRSDKTMGYTSYFYFDFNDSEKQNWRMAMRSLLLQFCLQMPDQLHSLNKLYIRYENGLKQPSEEDLRSLLSEVLAVEGNKYIILDALDECDDPQPLLNLIQDLVKREHQKTHILVTSRPEPDIQERLSLIIDYKVNIQNAVIKDDIRAYVEGRLANDAKLRKWQPAVQSKIVEELTQKADGMFRWVYCQLESLRKCIKLSALERTLSSLPATLDITYERILQKIATEGELDLALWLLQWLCFSKRPLRLPEMNEVLAMRKDNQQGFFPDERLPDLLDVVRLCSSLVTLSRINYESVEIPCDDKYYDVAENRDLFLPYANLRFAHYSVKEYLLSERCVYQSDFAFEASNTRIAGGCLSYLSYLCKQAPLNYRILDQCSLAQYTAQYWWQHTQDAGDKLDISLVDSAHELILDDKNNLITWVQLFDIDARSQRINFNRTALDVQQPIYYLALLGLPDLVEQAMHRGEITDVNVSGGFYHAPLIAAAASGHKKIVQMLLEAGADVKSSEMNGCFTPLAAAAHNGHAEVVSLLLEAGAEVDHLDDLHGTALMAASDSGHGDVVQMLLSAGANVDLVSGASENALISATRSGHRDTVRILIDAGADTAIANELYGITIQIAAAKNHVQIIRMLLEPHANGDGSNEMWTIAILSASKWKNGEAVRALLDMREGIANVVTALSAPLQAASSRGNLENVRILLDAGVDVNSHGPERLTALIAASKANNLEMVTLLLGAGANVNFRGAKDLTPLMAASKAGGFRTVTLLLDAGADIEIRYDGQKTARDLAADKGHSRIVEVLDEAKMAIKRTT